MQIQNNSNFKLQEELHHFSTVQCFYKCHLNINQIKFYDDYFIVNLIKIKRAYF